MRTIGYWMKRTAALNAGMRTGDLVGDLAEASVVLWASRRPGLSQAVEAFIDAAHRYVERHPEAFETNERR